MASKIVGCLILAFLAIGAVFTFKGMKDADTSESNSIITARNISNEPSGDMLLKDSFPFMQSDPEWAGEKIGDTDDTLETMGGAVSSSAIVLANMGFPTDPDKLNTQLSKMKALRNEGEIDWSAIKEVSGNMATVLVFEQPSHEEINKCLDGKNYPVIQFRLLSGRPHWVVLVGRKSREYLVRDPLVRYEAPIILSSRTTKIHSLRCFKRTGSVPELSAEQQN